MIIHDNPLDGWWVNPQISGTKPICFLHPMTKVRDRDEKDRGDVSRREFCLMMRGWVKLVGYGQTYQQKLDDTARILMDLERTYKSRRNDQHRIIFVVCGARFLACTACICASGPVKMTGTLALWHHFILWRQGLGLLQWTPSKSSTG